MVGHCATELLVGAQNEIERTPRRDPEMREAKNALEPFQNYSAGAGCKKTNLPAKGEVFLLDIPFYRTRPPHQAHLPADSDSHCIISAFHRSIPDDHTRA
jgi:hypothetical protein